MKHLALLSLLLLIAVPMTVGADTYSTLSGVPGLERAAEASQTGDFSVMINTLYRMTIGIGSALAVLMIVYLGITYAMEDSVGGKSQIRERFPLVIFGLLLLVGAYTILEFINPHLTNLSSVSIASVDYSGISMFKASSLSVDGAIFQSGISGTEMLANFDNMSVTDYTRIFGSPPPANRVVNGRIALNAQELRTLLGQYDGGVTSPDGISPGESVDDIGVNITPQAQLAVASAIRLHNLNGRTIIPESWADEPGLYKIMAKESGGVVGIPNYALRAYMQARGISQSRMAADIRSNAFYYNHCCRVTSQSSREARENGLPYQCNPATNSGLMDFTQAMANNGVENYQHIAGKCPSATGIGQLLNKWKHRYYPSNVSGYGNSSEEIYGMLAYIKEAYGNPANAWAKYKTGVGY